MPADQVANNKHGVTHDRPSAARMQGQPGGVVTINNHLAPVCVTKELQRVLVVSLGFGEARCQSLLHHCPGLQDAHEGDEDSRREQPRDSRRWTANGGGGMSQPLLLLL
eukprot:314072-Prorocentrum_minimum.AAC.3